MERSTRLFLLVAAVLLVLVLLIFAPPLAQCQYVPPYVALQGTLSTSSGLAAQNATITFSPSQVCFVPGQTLVVQESQCATDVNGNVVGVGNPLSPPRASVQYVGTLPPGNYYIEFTWYDQFGIQTLPSPEVTAQLTHTGELQILPPVGTGPPQAVGMAVYIGTASGTETLQGLTSSLTAQYTQATPLGSPVSAVGVTSGGQFPSCPTAFTFTGGGGNSAAATPLCSVSGGIYTITGATGLAGGYGYATAPTVGTSGSTPTVAPVLYAVLTPVLPPIRNITACRVIANDACFPTGTGYNVGLLDSSGNTLFNYPEMWQFIGPGSTYNLSQGIPYYHGQVTYPIPILTIPYNHNPQSISGPLSLSGYNIYSLGAVGVGTALPAWGVDVEGTGLDAIINAKGGYLLNGEAGSTDQAPCSDGTYIDRFCTFLTSVGSLYYQTVEANASAAPQEPKLNLIAGLNTTVAAVDNPSQSRTDVTITSTAISTGANPNIPTITGSGAVVPSSGYNDGAGTVLVTQAAPSFCVAFGGTYPHRMSCAASATTTGGATEYPVVSTPVEYAITGWAITSNVASFSGGTGAFSGLTAGTQLQLDQFPTSTFFNGQTVTVLSTGLSSTQFEADFTHANASNTEAGFALPDAPYSVCFNVGGAASEAMVISYLCHQ